MEMDLTSISAVGNPTVTFQNLLMHSLFLVFLSNIKYCGLMCMEYCSYIWKQCHVLPSIFLTLPKENPL